MNKVYRVTLVAYVGCALINSIAVANDLTSRIDMLGWLGQGVGGERQSFARAINNLGQVVGESTFEPGSSRAYRYTDGVGMENLGRFQGDPLTIVATDINDSGEVAGWAPNFSGDKGFRYRDGIGFTVIGPLQASTRILSINNSGLAAGYTDSNAFTQRPGETPVNFGPRRTTPLSVNNAGFVTGYAPNTSGLERAFVASPSGSVSFIPIPADSNRSEGHGINDAGQVVGYTLNNSLSNTGAFVWSESMGFQRLALLQPGVPAVAEAINIHGWIVGNSSNNTGVLWMPGHSPTNLNDYVHNVLHRPEITILTAEDINDFGQIVGQASIGGVRQGYRLTIPAPSSVALLAITTVTVNIRRRRR